MIDQSISHYKVLEKPGGRGGIVYSALGFKLNCTGWLQLSPKARPTEPLLGFDRSFGRGIDTLTEGNLPANLDGGRPRAKTEAKRLP
jgi:hypothetical protein